MWDSVFAQIRNSEKTTWETYYKYYVQVITQIQSNKWLAIKR